MTIKEIIETLSKYNENATINYLHYNDGGKYLDIGISVEESTTKMEFLDDGSLVFRRVNL